MDEQGKWLPKSRKVYDLDENGERIRLASGNWKCHKAVSYTHLRAHETPEHLVCRLLLEKKKGFTLVPSRYIEFVNRDENIDFDTKMKSLQGELKELLVQEEKSKSDLLAVFKELGYEIEL